MCSDGKGSNVIRRQGGRSYPRADAQQRGIEVALLGLGVDFEERRQPPPDHAQRIDIGAVDLLEHGEEAALLVVIVEDELGDVHREVVRVFR